ncbi:MAG: hypothetical protein ACKV19_06260 [Verrucomicrobiales bacterium]
MLLFLLPGGCRHDPARKQRERTSLAPRLNNGARFNERLACRQPYAVEGSAHWLVIHAD